MNLILTCITQGHDERLLLLAALICTVGVYASNAIAAQAARSAGSARRMWGSISVISVGCTAWSTHMVALLAYRPGMASGFDPVLTAVSLVCPIAATGACVALNLGTRQRSRRFLAGLVLGLGVALLHYIGQAGYFVTGEVAWNSGLIAGSLLVSFAMWGSALVLASERNRTLRRCAVPCIIAAIAVLHLGGMSAITLTYDPRIALPKSAVAPSLIGPVIAVVCLGLLTLAFVGLRFNLAAAAQQRKDQARLREFASLALEGLAVCDGNIIVAVNQSFERLSGVLQTDLERYSLCSVLPSVVLTDLPELEERDTELITATGQSVPVRVLCKQVSLGHKRQMIVAVRDQRERLQTEARMRSLAFNDPLTGLPNRTRFGELLEHFSAAWREHDRPFCVLLINLDRFKLVNDTLGHPIGDRLLRDVAARLQSVVSDPGIIARLGGDEFAVLHSLKPSADAPDRLAAQIVEVLGQPFPIDQHMVNIGVSIGVVIAPRDGVAPAELLRHADLAMCQAKVEGKARFRMFEPALAQVAEARRVLESDMRSALKCQQFEVHFQPLVDSSSGIVTAAEALVRWRHPHRGIIPPSEFIPIAEETGMIIELGAWVLDTACVHAVTWPDDIKVAVNLSPVQFRDDRLLETVTNVLVRTGLPADRLELEITEGVMLDDEERTLATLLKLRAADIGIAMDDFGTGFASLSYLRRFPFSKVKVDRSFVQQLPENTESAAIMRAIITMSKCLGMTTTVEGVETAEQLAFVTAEHCGQIQGFHVSRPLPPAAFMAFLNDIEKAECRQRVALAGGERKTRQAGSAIRSPALS